jgi:hypothetical protein
VLIEPIQELLRTAVGPREFLKFRLRNQNSPADAADPELLGGNESVEAAFRNAENRSSLLLAMQKSLRRHKPTNFRGF